MLCYVLLAKEHVVLSKA